MTMFSFAVDEIRCDPRHGEQDVVENQFHSIHRRPPFWLRLAGRLTLTCRPVATTSAERTPRERRKRRHENHKQCTQRHHLPTEKPRIHTPAICMHPQMSGRRYRLSRKTLRTGSGPVCSCHSGTGCSSSSSPPADIFVHNNVPCWLRAWSAVSYKQVGRGRAVARRPMVRGKFRQPRVHLAGDWHRKVTGTTSRVEEATRKN